MSSSLSKKSGKGKIKKNRIKKGIWIECFNTKNILPLKVGSNVRENIQKIGRKSLQQMFKRRLY